MTDNKIERFNTKTYAAVLRQAADLLEHMDKLNSHVSGNGTESVLECCARIATCEPDNPLYEGEVQRMSQISEALRNTYEDLQDASGHFLSVGEHFNLYKNGGWFHMQSETQAITDKMPDATYLLGIH